MSDQLQVERADGKFTEFYSSGNSSVAPVVDDEGLGFLGAVT